MAKERCQDMTMGRCRRIARWVWGGYLLCDEHCGPDNVPAAPWRQR